MERMALVPLTGDEVISNGVVIPLADRLWIKVNGPWYGDAPGPDDCWEWMGKSAIGVFIMKDGRRIRNRRRWSYGRIRSAGGGTPIIGAHVAAWIVTFGAVPDGMYVCHRCDNHLCCNPSHLYIGTALQNNHDAIARGRRNRGRPPRSAPPSEKLPAAVTD